MEKKTFYRKIPNVNSILKDRRVIALFEEYGRDCVKNVITEILNELRDCIERENEKEFENKLERLYPLIGERVAQKYEPEIRRVINATGTVLHTNLGRAPLSEKHLEYLMDIASGYSNLEYNLSEGKRGERYSHFEKVLCELTGAESAMAVNNNAAAVLLTLSALASGGETIVSRGELIEIGGKFRIPDVCEQSGSILKEVGTTNKTHPSDYREAISDETKVFFKAHTSNYRIIGFTESVDAEEMVQIVAESQREIPVIEDMGSGALIDFSQFGLEKEPTVQEEIRKGVDIVTFSGDKLLGGTQAGIIVGKKKYIDKLKKHPLTRVLRIDKLTVAVLDLVLREYLSEERAIKEIPVLQMLQMKEEELKEKAQTICQKLADAIKERELEDLVELQVVMTRSTVGGGSMPLSSVASYAIAVKSKKLRLSELERRMRHLAVPIIGRLEEDRMILDVRCIFDRDIPFLEKGILTCLGR